MLYWGVSNGGATKQKNSQKQASNQFSFLLITWDGLTGREEEKKTKVKVYGWSEGGNACVWGQWVKTRQSAVETCCPLRWLKKIEDNDSKSSISF